ncbi:hypothetical protein HXX76_001925 [Chlamydomonas incerta]|uniref:Uncharacterized protein n=1 Tax=Chlamydomonas incerta TaxID=51695 RepID=A0A836B0C1_CHLIN|nr:hypothetical protein HXX76_001925 [Chlamydomonas incerta]|eukprot:KAG2443574.1 hypothetical protein HXX76_001925 [Chlamydomonas incerta]
MLEAQQRLSAQLAERETEIAQLKAALEAAGGAGVAGEAGDVIRQQQQQQGLGVVAVATAAPGDAGEGASGSRSMNEDALLRNSGTIELTPEKAEELGLSLSELVGATVNSLQDVVTLLRGSLPRDSELIATWLFIRLQPIPLREDLRMELQKAGGVIPSWEWLADWFRGRIAAAEEPSQLVAWCEIKKLGEAKNLPQFLQSMADWDRLVSGKVDLAKLKVLQALSVLPPKVRNNVLRRTTPDGRQEDWTDYAAFESLLRSYAPQFPDYGKSSGGASSGAAGGASGAGGGSRKRGWEGGSGASGSVGGSGAGAKKGGAAGGAVGKTTYPFDMNRTKSLFVRGLTDEKRKMLADQKKCFICESKDGKHTSHYTCPFRGPTSNYFKSGHYYYFDFKKK